MDELRMTMKLDASLSTEEALKQFSRALSVLWRDAHERWSGADILGPELMFADGEISATLARVPNKVTW